MMPKEVSEVMKSKPVEFCGKRMKRKSTDFGFSDRESDRDAKTSSVNTKLLSEKISTLVDVHGKRMKRKTTDSDFSDRDGDWVEKTSNVDSKLLSEKISTLIDFQGKRIKRKTTDSGFFDRERDRVEKTSSIDSKLLSEKALRALMIKSRFAETIFKAQDKMIKLNAGNKAVKERLEKKKAEIRSGAEIERKMSREKEREAASIALEKMEKVVEWNDAIQVEMEFEKLIGVRKIPVG